LQQTWKEIQWQSKRTIQTSAERNNYDQSLNRFWTDPAESSPVISPITTKISPPKAASIDALIPAKLPLLDHEFQYGFPTGLILKSCTLANVNVSLQIEKSGCKCGNAEQRTRITPISRISDIWMQNS
jgi:hypothetical protein